MPTLELRVLGPLEVLRAGAPVAVTAPQQRRLLSLLALRADEPVSQDELIDALWAGDAPRTARAAFQNQIHALRRRLGAETVERTAAGYVLRVGPEALDVARFRGLVAESRSAPAVECAAKLRQALALWRGPALPDLAGHAAAEAAIARLEEERMSALEDRIEAELSLGDHATLVPELEELVAREPLRERLWSQLMLALYRAGRQADALASYRRAHEAFTGALGIEPGVVLRELQRAILVQDRALDDPRRTLGSTLERAASIMPRDPRERAQSLYDYGSALIRVGELRQAASTLQAAGRLADRARERGVAERVRVQLSYLAVFADGASMDGELPVAERAARALADLGDDAGHAFALAYQAHLLRDTGRAEVGLGLALRAADLAARAGDHETTAVCRRMAAHCAAIGPTPVPEALVACEAADGAGGEGGPRPAWDAAAWLLAQSGRITEARELCERELELLRRRDLVLSLTVGLARAALAERAAGQLARAAAHLRTAYALVRAQGVRGDVPACAGELACVLALQGEHAEAVRLVREARACLAPADILGETLCLRALAVVSARQGAHDEARRLADEARAHADRTDWLTFRGETLEEAAYVHGLAGDAWGEAEALRAALEAFEWKGNVAGANRVRATLAGLEPWHTEPPSGR